MYHLHLSGLLSAILSYWKTASRKASTYRSISWSTVVLWRVRLLYRLDASRRRCDIVIQISESLRELINVIQVSKSAKEKAHQCTRESHRRCSRFSRAGSKLEDDSDLSLQFCEYSQLD